MLPYSAVSLNLVQWREKQEGRRCFLAINTEGWQKIDLPKGLEKLGRLSLSLAAPLFSCLTGLRDTPHFGTRSFDEYTLTPFTLWMKGGDTRLKQSTLSRAKIAAVA
jgi:hypothetical protein